jgi:apolipoprotein N-acyltransferase
MNLSAIKNLSESVSVFSYWKRALLCLIAGCVSALAMAPYSLWPALLLGLVTLYFMASTENTYKGAFGLIWTFHFGYFVAGLWWISNALLTANNQFIWAWPLATIALPAILALFPAIICSFVPKKYDLKIISGFLFFVASMSVSEWLRGHMFSGFPWNSFGYGWSKALPIVQTVSIGGIYFLTSLTIFWFCAPAYLILSKSPILANKILYLLLITILSSTIYGQIRIGNNPALLRDDIAIKIVQPNISQDEKWDSKLYSRNLQKYLDMSFYNEKDDKNDASYNQDRKTIIIWPETAITSYHIKDISAKNAIKSTLQSYNSGNIFLLSGMLRINEDALFNSIVVYDSNMELLATYNKSHLVPFGEYIPFQKYIPLQNVTNFNGFVAGSPPRLYSLDKIPSFIPLVCYEILFPAISDSNNAEWIVNVTNDAWYGNSPGPYQHFDMAIYRAVEKGTPVVRSAGTGISGVIDPVGRIISKTKLLNQETLFSYLPRNINTGTIYSKSGDLSLFILIIIFIASGFYYSRNIQK